MSTITAFRKGVTDRRRSRHAKDRRGLGCTTVRLRFETLEQRTLLEVGGLLASELGTLRSGAAAESQLARPADLAEASAPVALTDAADDPRVGGTLWAPAPDEVLVGLRSSTRRGQLSAYIETIDWPEAMGAVSTHNVDEVYTIRRGDGNFLTVARIHLQNDLAVPEAIAELQELEIVEYAERTGFFLESTDEADPSDPLQFGEGLEPGDPQRYHHDLMETPAAWDWFQPDWGGSGVLVAVVDSGFDSDHEDLADNVRPGGTPYGGSHGTHVAGAIAAVTDNAIGVAGVAGDAEMILLYRGDNPEQRAAKFVSATDEHQAQILNCSQAGIPEAGREGFETYRNALDHMYRNGVLYIQSAGNHNEAEPDRLNFHQALYVAATNALDQGMYRPHLSARTNYGTGIDIAAPGEEVFSTETNTYGMRSGTSVSAAGASGTAALIWSKEAYQERTPQNRDKVAAVLLGTVDNIDDVQLPDPPGAHPAYAGLLGSGRVNANRAINGTLPPPRIQRIREIPDALANGGTLSEFTVDLANVFKTSVWGDAVWDPVLERSIYEVDTTGPLDDPDNWELVFAGEDGIFYDQLDPADQGNYPNDDAVIALTLEYINPDFTEYSNLPGYKIGMNDLQFTLPGDLQNGRYRFTARAQTAGHLQGLSSPFAEGDAGDDFAADKGDILLFRKSRMSPCSAPCSLAV